mmetsp:Transcript_98706/g.156014  ORF Transcript_98706/g.156014 Transcript_98706/m.156014 type:complete len:531 (-) Transcript_98706:95-1687(-)
MAKKYNGGSSSLSDFKQLALLGEGAYSAVYKVMRLADKEIYALKKVKLPSLSDKEKQNALNEVRLLASVRHENIIAYKEAFFDDKTRCLCIVTDMADSGDLFQTITKCQKERAHLPEVDVWRYIHGMCHGLKALHDMNILHRDMKCANVFLSNKGGQIHALLGDFNVSKVAKRGLCMTQTGTPYYASPEVWRDMPYDAKSDMWSLGCVLYEMVALRPPFRAEDMEGLYRKVLRGQYPRIPAHYSNDLAEVIGILLQVNPRHRPSVDQLLQTPVMKRHSSDETPDQRALDLLSTIKLPKNAIDLAGCLPAPQYDINLFGPRYDVAPPIQESPADVAGGSSKILKRRTSGGRVMPSQIDEKSLLEPDNYQDSLDAYMSPSPPDVNRDPAAVVDNNPRQGILPPIMQANPPIIQADSLDAYLQHKNNRVLRQHHSPASGYSIDTSAEDPRHRHGSGSPSSQSRAPPPIYGGQHQQYRHRLGAGERKPMASYARQQYALGGGSSAVAQAPTPMPRQQSNGGGLRLPRIFSTKAA